MNDCERCGEPRPRFEVRSFGNTLVHVHLAECPCRGATAGLESGVYTVRRVPLPPDTPVHRYVAI